jgi:hypothetical protein
MNVMKGDVKVPSAHPLPSCLFILHALSQSSGSIRAAQEELK